MQSRGSKSGWIMNRLKERIGRRGTEGGDDLYTDEHHYVSNTQHQTSEIKSAHVQNIQILKHTVPYMF